MKIFGWTIMRTKELEGQRQAAHRAGFDEGVAHEKRVTQAVLRGLAKRRAIDVAQKMVKGEKR